MASEHGGGGSYVATIVAYGMPFVILPVAVVAVAVKEGAQALFGKKEVREDPNEALRRKLAHYAAHPADPALYDPQNRPKKPAGHHGHH